jgi:hypothetical protein
MASEAANENPVLRVARYHGREMICFPSGMAYACVRAAGFDQDDLSWVCVMYFGLIIARPAEQDQRATYTKAGHKSGWWPVLMRELGRIFGRLHFGH